MADEDKGKLGAINVEMGDGNTVAHIGHIVFHQPAPDPNSIWQRGVVIGSIGADPQQLDATTYLFPKLFTDRDLPDGAEFQVQGITLRLKAMDSVTAGSTGGRPLQFTLWNVTCEVIA